MKNSALIAIAALLIAAPLAQSNEKLAMLNTSQAIALAQFNSHRAIPSNSMRTYQVKARRKVSHEDFDAKMSKMYPANYRMMTALDTATRENVYTDYKRGERLSDLRKQVIVLYTDSMGE